MYVRFRITRPVVLCLSEQRLAPCLGLQTGSFRYAVVCAHHDRSQMACARASPLPLPRAQTSFGSMRSSASGGRPRPLSPLSAQVRDDSVEDDGYDDDDEGKNEE